MNKNAIQNDRDRIGYTKRTRRKDKGANDSKSPEQHSSPFIASLLNEAHDDTNSDFGEGISPYGRLDADMDDTNPDSPHNKVSQFL